MGNLLTMSLIWLLSPIIPFLYIAAGRHRSGTILTIHKVQSRPNGYFSRLIRGGYSVATRPATISYCHLTDRWKISEHHPSHSPRLYETVRESLAHLRFSIEENSVLPSTPDR